MPWMSIADRVLPGLNPSQPNQRIRPPTAPRMMLCGIGGPPPSRLNTRPSRGPSAIAPMSEMAPPIVWTTGDPEEGRSGPADGVDDGRPGEVAERDGHHREPSVGPPGPVADDRVDEAGDA